MKSIQKRIYNVLPRVSGAAATSASSTVLSPTSPQPPRARSIPPTPSRSFHAASGNLPLNFFDAPPTPSSRASIPSAGRLPVEIKPAEVQASQSTPQGHSSQTNASHCPLLALSQPQSNSGHTLVGNSHGSPHHSLFSYSLTSAPKLYQTLPTTHGHRQHAQAKKHKPKYQLYVGAYGIPKKCSAYGISSSRRGRPAGARATENDMDLAVQVGEDAYFIRDNAMGVADGVGGWARAKPKDLPLRSSGSKAQPTPSALFARRLMHFCSAEVDTVSDATPLSSPPLSPIQPPSRPQFSFSHLPSRPAPAPILVSHAPSLCWSDSTSPSFLSTPISSSLPSASTFTPPSRATTDEISALEQDLEESLEELSEGIDVLQVLERAYDRTLKAHVVAAAESPPATSHSPSPAPQGSNQSIDIPSKSSPPSQSELQGKNTTTEMVPLMSGSSTALLAVLDHVPRQDISQLMNDPSRFPSIMTTNLEAEDGYDAVIKIAHVGDCMGMLVRGDEIAWRSEEMWWDFNTPVQLGPATPTTPRTSAHVFTLPVRADDILIFATDGLSDNLWDEDVLDEVVRFRRSFLGLDVVSHSSQREASQSQPLTAAERVLRRRTLAGMLSEALCSRARRVSERRHCDQKQRNVACEETLGANVEDEVPFARRAREAGKMFRGGKNDDISVIVAVISPAADLAEEAKSL
ncbi:hypothetical protein AX15_007568 [Amanita polypyramis BW_CC]|nr:hypothetical protein AX15_007568 [Amanita polypyramis BW_CC]